MIIAYFGSRSLNQIPNEKEVNLIEPKDQELKQFCCKIQDIIVKLRTSNKLYYGGLFSSYYLARIPALHPETDRLSNFGADLLSSVYDRGYGCYEMQVFIMALLIFLREKAQGDEFDDKISSAKSCALMSLPTASGW